MKRILVLLFAGMLCQNLSAQNIPYYEPFASSNSLSSNGGDWIPEIETAARAAFPTQNSKYGRSLRMIVEQGDDPFIPPPVDGRSRSEVRLEPSAHAPMSSQTFYYSWDVFVPNDIRFPAEKGGGFYHIMQWHPGNYIGYCSINRPVMALSIINKEAHSLDGKFDLHLIYGTNYGSCADDNNDGVADDICTNDPYSVGKRVYTVRDGIQKGEWAHIVMKITWHYDGAFTAIRMWINDLPIIKLNSNDYSFCDDDSPDNTLIKGSSSQTAYTMGDAPLIHTFSVAGNTIEFPPYQKLGHYRKDYANTNTLFLDNYRISTEYPPSPFETFLEKDHCNVLIDSEEDYNISAFELSPVTQYKFRFKDGNNYHYFNSLNPYCNLLERSWAEANKTYDVDVKVVNSISGFNYSKVCQVTTPKLTKLKPGDCNSGSNGQLTCEPILQATTYKWRFRDSAGNYHWRDTSTNTIDISDRPYFDSLGDMLFVQVRAITASNPSGFAYGEECWIKRSTYLTDTEDLDNTAGEFERPAKNASAQDLVLYPNPAKDLINIQLPAGFELIQKTLFDVNGRVINTGGNELFLDISGVQNGIYFMKLETSEGIFVKRVVKQ